MRVAPSQRTLPIGEHESSCTLLSHSLQYCFALSSSSWSLQKRSIQQLVV